MYPSLYTLGAFAISEDAPSASLNLRRQAASMFQVITALFAAIFLMSSLLFLFLKIHPHARVVTAPLRSYLKFAPLGV